MADTALVLVHSPLVGPLTWRAVADDLTGTGWTVVVPDLTGAVAGDGPYLPAITELVAARVAALDAPVTLVGHSGAGPLLPGIAGGLPRPVQALVYVDAGLPHPGRSWWECAPAELVAHLRGLADGDRLPPWHQWFPPETVADLLPDPGLRARFEGEVPALPLAYFQERMPGREWSGRAGYLLLSEAYRQDAVRAAAQGMPVLERPSDHLAMLTAPRLVAAALRDLLR